MIFMAFMTARRPHTASDDERELVEAARAGDAEAFTAVYRLHARTAYARLSRLLGPVDEREDLLQQVFIELGRALPRYRGDASLATFIRRIATHVAYRYLRARRRRPAVPFSAVQLAAFVAPGTPADERARARDDLRELFELLARVKPKKRIAFLLVAVEGMSLAGAAEELEINEAAVKQRVLAARRELDAMIARARRRDVGPG